MSIAGTGSRPILQYHGGNHGESDGNEDKDPGWHFHPLGDGAFKAQFSGRVPAIACHTSRQTKEVKFAVMEFPPTDRWIQSAGTPPS
jgi:hypothetical protein